MMRQIKQSLLIIALIICLFTGLFLPQVHAQQAVSDVYDSASAYMVKNVPVPSYNNEWFILSLARGEYKVPANYFETYYKNLAKEVKDRDGILHTRKYTEYSRVILALSAIGKDAHHVGGYDLVEKLYDFDHVVWQGINGPIFALIALDSWQYEIPKTATNSREKMISYIIDKQLADGGFSLSGTQLDIDITAMAIQALSTYANQPNVEKSIDHALEALSNLLIVNGKVDATVIKSSESLAQIITATSSLTINPEKDKRFSGLIDALLQYYDATAGGFKHLLSETTSNAMATEQASYALTAYSRMLSDQTRLYDMTDVKPAVSSFIDLSQHWASEVVEQAVELGLMNGYPDETFRPEESLTRVQAAALITRALGLHHTADAPYTDISQYNHVTQNEIAAAYEAGIIQLNNGTFSPASKLTRAQFALMLTRAYQYKTGVKYEATKVAPFTDIAELKDETKMAVTFLYDNKLAEGVNGKFLPSDYTTRAQAAKIMVNFYHLVK